MNRTNDEFFVEVIGQKDSQNVVYENLISKELKPVSVLTSEFDLNSREGPSMSNMMPTY